MNLQINRQDGTPIYVQIRRQVEQLVRDGMLPAGSRLPSVRQLAGKLGVAKNTVTMAYAELVAAGIIESRRGSGAYVCQLPEVATGVNLDRRREMSPELQDYPAMRWEPYFFSSDFFMMPRSKRGGELIRFTQAYPDPALFPFERIKQITTNMLWNPQEHFFDIGHAQGFQPLVEHLEKEMALAGVPMAPGQNDIILTGGFQRALSLALDFLLKPGQKVAIESPCYSGLLNLLIAKRIDYVPVPVDGQGMDTDHLGGVLARDDIRAIITIPTFHNPTGVSLSRKRREHLLRLAMEYRVPVIEDDWGRRLRFEGEDVEPLKALDHGGYVIHVGTFSKCFLPGLRLGWITCPSAIGVQLLRAKVGADCGDSFFLQAFVHEFIVKGHFDRHLRKSLAEYKRRRDAMCDVLAESLPAGCRFRVPQGGFSIWVELPEQVMSVPLLGLAREAGVEFLPAAFVMPQRRDAPALRLAFSRNNLDEIRVGTARLCELILRCIDNPRLLRKGAAEFEDLYR
jgi:GntR family transcriptional regulator/MocR family aminotransferase